MEKYLEDRSAQLKKWSQWNDVIGNVFMLVKGINLACNSFLPEWEVV